MDFFSKDFNASLALKELAVPDGQTPVIFDSIDEFEENLIRTNAPLVRELQKIEADKRCTKKKRKERLSNVCAAVGRTVLETLPSKKTVQKSDAGPLKKLSECVEQKRCVTIVLRGLNTVNCHISAQIVSFDNHWNLIIRNGNERFRPSVKLRKRGARVLRERLHPYIEECSTDLQCKTKPIWHRNLSFSLIRGDNIVSICIPEKSL